MADLGFTVNVNDLPDARNDFTPVPAGKYTAMLVNSRLMPTNATKEQMVAAGVNEYEVWRKSNPRANGYLALEFDIQDNGAVGRKLFHNLNLINDNQQTSEIAAAQLKQILQAFGMQTFSGKSEELHNKRLVIDVKIKEGGPKDKNDLSKGNWPAQNQITKFAPIGAQVGTTQSAATPAAAVGAAKGPWAR